MRKRSANDEWLRQVEVLGRFGIRMPRRSPSLRGSFFESAPPGYCISPKRDPAETLQ
jgi:hypothetical protein